jgi:membrane-bound ClpP family serine protease
LALMVAGIIVGSLLCQPAAAQHIYNTPPDGNGTAFIEIDGPIEADAYRRFENEIAARLPGGQGPAKSVVIRLSSPGGLIGPAIAIGTMIHAYHWATHVDDGAPCASACALIWLAGTPRSMTLGYQAALAVLGSGAERDLRIVEGIDD